MRILYVSHTAAIGGGEHSLLALLGALPDDVEPRLAVPRGPLADELTARGHEVLSIPGTAGSLRLHPVHTPITLAQLLAAGLAVARHARRQRADLLHANSIRAGIVCGLARLAGGPPVVVHVRDRLPPGRVTDATFRLLARTSAAFVANSRYTAAQLPATAKSVHVIGNPVELARFDPESVDRGAARERLGLPADAPVLAVVAQLTPWKGQDLAIEVLAGLREAQPDARLLLVGSAKFVSKATRYDNRAYVAELQARVAELDLADRVLFCGERSDIPEVLAATDVLLAPSWEEPFGRSIVEAMAMALPVIATDVGGPAEIVTSGVDGLLLAPREAGPWIEAVAGLLSDPARAAAIAQAARANAVACYAAESHSGAIHRLYGELLGTQPRAGASDR